MVYSRETQKMVAIAESKLSPLTEVVCGVEFYAPEFSSVHFGEYWQTIKDRFPFSIDRPPLDNVELFRLMPNLRRVWFESEDNRHLIQLQANRFHCNWRRQAQTDAQPTFQEVYADFEKEWRQFQDWCDGFGKVSLQSTRYELTYLNQIDSKFGWFSSEDHHKIFTFVGRDWGDCFIAPHTHSSSLEFFIPENLGVLLVNMSQSVRFQDNESLLLLELTARSFNTEMEINTWFKAAQKFIALAFLDLLSREIKQDLRFQWID